MHKTPGSAGSLTTWTLSVWLKRGNLGAEHPFFSGADPSTSSHRDLIRFNSDNTLNIYINGTVYRTTNRKFRDVSAWYHIVVNWDTTNGTAGSRVKLYVNGTEETAFSTSADPAEDAESNINRDTNQRVGREEAGTFYDGYMAEVCFIDGTIYGPTSFGEFDSDSPTIFKPIDVSGLTFGTNGFYLDFEASDNLGNDANGGTDLTESGLAAADQAVDSPTNNFCTLNPLHSMAKSASTNYPTTYSEGNCKLAPSNNDAMVHSSNTIPMPPKGKWYMELKFLSTNVSYGGIIDMDKVGAAAYANVDLSSSSTSGYNQVVYQTNYIFAGTSTSYGDDIEDDDIMGIAWDADNGALYIALNGTWQNSGDPTSGASKTNAIDISGQSWYGGVQGWSICIGDGSTSNGDSYEVSFGGCPGFAVSSAQADDNGYGIFEYDVPAGFYSICTKNLAEFGG